MPDDGPEPVLALIDQAQQSIRLKIYLFTYRDIRNALIRAANRGVDVRVLIDQEPVGGGESNAETYGILKEGGVDVKWAPGAFKHNHEKSLVVDDRVAMIATFNFTNSSFNANREYAVTTTQPDVVADVAAIFDADWAGEGVEVSADSPLALSPQNSRERITALIEGAQHSLWLEEATLLDEDITKTLIETAKRGVDVRFIAPQREEDDVAEDNLKRVADAGGQVAWLADPYVHAKVILADGKRAFVGSVNLSFTSFELNRELGIITEDEGVIGRLQETLAGDWKQAGGSDTARRSSTQVIPWQDAEDYVGQEVTVEGRIVHTYDSGKVTFLNFDEDYRNTLTIVMFPSIYDAFPGKPATYFDGELVRVRGKVKMYEGAPEIVVTDPEQITLLSSDASTRMGGVASTQAVAAPPSSTSSDDIIPWQQAEEHIGQRVTISGEVVRTYNSGKVAFLNFDEDWQGKFSVVIFASDFDAFPGPPDEIYLHQPILVTGKVKEYKGAPEIIVESPDQIEIVDQPGQTETREETPPESPRGVVSWRDAGDYIGQTITVEGRINRTKDIGSITFLNFGKKRGDFVAVVRAEDYDNFPSPPAELYDGKKVWMTGEITTHKGTPQMIIRGPEQVEAFQ